MLSNSVYQPSVVYKWCLKMANGMPVNFNNVSARMSKCHFVQELQDYGIDLELS